MPTRNHMTHRATIERGTVVTDGLGLDGPRTWTTHIASLACRWYAKDETEILDGRKVLILGGHRILVPLGADVVETDRVTFIKDRKGTTLVSNAMQIRGVIRRPDHKEIRLTEIA